jgi:hypothetical protein
MLALPLMLVMGYSTDKYPWVGQNPTRPGGLFVMAGFHGHGMW